MEQMQTTPPTGVAAPTPPATWRGRAAGMRQRVGVTVASLGMGLTFLFLMVASGLLLTSNASWTATPPDEGQLALYAWQYRMTGGAALRVIEWGYPPLLIGILLFAGVLLVGVNQGLANPIRKAQRKLVTFRWSASAERARMKAELHAAGYSSLMTAHAKVRVILTGVIAAMVAALAAFLPVQDGFTRGVGPTVCIVGGLVALAGVLLTTPWTHWPTVVLLADGRLMIDGQEPLATAPPSPTPPEALAVTAAVAAPTTAATPAAPGWYADPRGAHERRYWDGVRWTAEVADTEGARDQEPTVTI